VSALARRERPPREQEPLSAQILRRERIMLGLRLDEPLMLAGLDGEVDEAALDRLGRLELAELTESRDGGRRLTLTRRGRMLGGGVTADLLA
jgi:coproporphyrinogen III oxidase-like Fe-S oxidoreductase